MELFALKELAECNVGNCVDVNCDKTIGFPDGVVQYSTIVHLDLQTATFSSSKVFSKSFLFTNSDKFSESRKFSETFFFTKSKEFSESEKFSETFFFTKSKEFSETKKFSETFFFTKSDKFSESEKFSKSFIFIRSNEFSESEKFSETFFFTKSDKFSESEKFSETFFFTKSIEFSNKITESRFFSISEEFKDSLKLFIESNYFTNQFFITKTIDSLQTNHNLITFSQTVVQSLSYIKTVTFSFFYSYSISQYECNNSIKNEKMILCDTHIYTIKYLPYIIYSLSPVYIFTYILNEVKINKKMVTQEQLIGIVCGSATFIFSIVGIVIFIIRKRNSNELICIYDDYENNDFSSDIEVQTEISVSVKEITNNDGIELDNWI